MNIALGPSGTQEAQFEQQEYGRGRYAGYFYQGMTSFGEVEKHNDCSIKTWSMCIAVNTRKNYLRSSWFKRRKQTCALEEIPPALTPISQDSRGLFLDVLR